MRPRLRAILAPADNPIARALLALVFFGASLGGIALTSFLDSYVNSGVAWGPSYPQVANADVNPLGVNVFLEKEVDPQKVDKTLQMVRDGGFKWVRQTFAWNDIEIDGKNDFVDRRNPGQMVDSWSKYDRIVEECGKYGLQIIARLDSPPVWARKPGDDVQTFHKGPPANLSDYGDFVYNVASRYKGKIKYFQIWNEPNLFGEWGGHPVSPEEYTALLKVGYQAVKRADPEATVITAALAPTAEESLANLNDVLFLEGMYKAGAAPYFDILSTMLYGLGQPPDDRRVDLRRLSFARPTLLREVMEKNGDGAKPIWISEYAWISLPPDFEGDPAKNIWGRSVDEATQARYLVEGYERVRAEWPWAGVMFVWHIRQPDPIPGEPANYFAILRDDFTPRPAYDALKAYSGRFPEASTGFHDWTSPGAQFDRPSAGSAYTATIRFEGNRLDVNLAPTAVPVTVTLDNGPPKSYTAGAGSSTFARGLPYGPHSLAISVTPGEEPLFKDFTVYRDRPLWNAWSFPLAYLVFGLLALASAGFGMASLGSWAAAAVNRPRGRYSAAVREMARNGAAVVAMALLVGLYYRSQSLLLVLAALAGLGLLAFLKPSTALAGVVFVIPFFWYPKEIRSQHFPLAETLLLVVFAALMARRIVAYLFPDLALRLNMEPTGGPRPAIRRARRRVAPARTRRTAAAQPSVPTRGPATTYLGRPPAGNGASQQSDAAQSRDDGDTELAPAHWPERPVTGPLTPVRVRLERVPHPTTPLKAGKITEPLDDLVLEARRAEAMKRESVEAAARRADEETPRRGRIAARLGAALSNPRPLLREWAARFRAWSRQDAFAPPAVALLAVGTLSLLTLADPSFARDSARAYRWVIVEPVLFYFLITDIVSTRRGLWRLADFFVAAAVGISLLGIWQYFSDTGTLAVEGVSRVFGVYQHPNNLALYLGRVLPFTLIVGVFLPWSRRKAFYLAASLPLAATVILTFSRGAWVAITVAVLVGLAAGLRWRTGYNTRTAALPVRRRVLYGSALSLVVGLALIATAALLPRLPERVFAAGSGELRVKLWESSLRMIADHPVFGVGPDQFLNQFQAKYITPEQEKERYTAHPHNIFLDYWLTLGIMGLLILLWLLWRYFREAVGTARRLAREPDPDPVGRAMALGLLALMVDFLVHGLVDNSYFLMDLAMIFWLSCGLLQSINALRQAPEPAGNSR